jgi:hypothetical protein
MGFNIYQSLDTVPARKSLNLHRFVQGDTMGDVACDTGIERTVLSTREDVNAWLAFHATIVLASGFRRNDVVGRTPHPTALRAATLPVTGREK